MSSSLYEDLEWRGLVKQVTDPSIKKHLDSGSVTFYIGFDPTSDCLHIGHFLGLVTMLRFQKAGHRPIAVVGGATGMIGDPSGKSQERNLLTPEVIDRNVVGVRKVFERYLDFEGQAGAKVINNADWFKGISYLEFLRDIGKHFTINHMMQKDSVKTRLEDREHGISYTEFSYMLLQAYDFYVLNHKENCTLQVGGSDQWGNITAGNELIRRMHAVEAEQTGKANTKTPEVFGLTHPLITKSDGTKFGKTEGGALWLDAERTSPYELYQYFVRVADDDVKKLLRYFTFLSREEIEALDRAVEQDPGKRDAQKTLAREVVGLIHGKEELARAEAATQALFGTEIQSLDEKTLRAVLGDSPSTEKSLGDLKTGLGLVDLLAETGMCKSKGAARKDLTAGGIYVNNERVQDAAAQLESKNLIADKFIVLRKGKKNYHLLCFS